MLDASPVPHAELPIRSEAPDRADVVVLGASLAGLHLARRLAEAGASVVCIERRNRLEDGVEGRDPGVLTGGLPEHPWRLVAAIGAAKAGLLYDLSDRGISLAAPDGGAQATHAAIDEREIGELEKSAHALRASGREVIWLDAEQTCAHLGGEGFTAGMQVAGERSTNTGELMVRVAREAMAAGVVVVPGIEARRLGTDAQGAVVRHPEGEIGADVVVLAGDHHLAKACPWLSDKLVPVREHALRIPSDRSLPPARAQYGYLTWRCDETGGVRISGCRWATPHLEVFETEERPSDTVLDALRGLAAKHLGLTGPPSHRWARILTATCDGLPITGPLPGDPTTVCCMGFQGFAPALSMAAAEDVATGLLTGQAPLPDWLTPSRFL